MKWCLRIHRDPPIPKDPLLLHDPGSCWNSLGSAGIHPRDPRWCRCRGCDPLGSQCHLLLAPFPVTRLPGASIHLPASSSDGSALGASRRSWGGSLMFLGWGEGGNTCLVRFIPLGIFLEASSLLMSYSEGVGMRRSGEEFPTSLHSPRRDLRKNQSLKLFS